MVWYGVVIVWWYQQQQPQGETEDYLRVDNTLFV